MTQPSRAFTDMLTGDRIYMGINEKDRFESVTSILSSLPKQLYLVPWAAKLAAERAADSIDDLIGDSGNAFLDTHYAMGTDDEVETTWIDREGFIEYVKNAWREVRDDAGNVGDEVHDALDSIVSFAGGDATRAKRFAETLSLSEDAARYVGHFIQFLEDNEVEVVANEFTVYNDTHGYAGTCDLAAWVNGEPWYIDFKTSNRVYDETALQIAAYSRGEYIIQDGKQMAVRLDMPWDWDSGEFAAGNPRGGVLHFMKTKVKFIEVDISDEMFDCFLSLLLVKRLWLGTGQKEALGAVIYDSAKAKKEKEKNNE